MDEEGERDRNGGKKRHEDDDDDCEIGMSEF